MSNPPFLEIRIALLLVLLSPARAQTSSSKTNSVGQDFSQESVIVERSKSTLIFQNDGSYVNEQHVRARIQSEAGVRQYGVLSFPYQSSDGNVEVPDVRVTKPDGTVIVTDPNSVQEVTSEISRLAPMYTDMREKHVPVKGLEPGDTLEYSVKFSVNKPLIPGQFWMSTFFTKNLVVLDEQEEISVPREREIKLKSQTIQPTMHDEGSRRIYIWKRSNLESQSLQKQREVQSYDAVRGLLPPPDVLISSFRSWEELGRWYDRLQREKIQPSAEIKAKADELTKGLTDDDSKIRAVYNYVSLRYRYISIGFGVGRYQPHAATEILGNHYGDCKDRHTLLAALLSAVGIHAYPALINTQMSVDADVPSPGQFDHVISVVTKGNNLLWMDTTPEVAAMGYLMGYLRGKRALVISPDKVTFQTTPTDPPFTNRDDFRVIARLNADGTLEAHSEAIFRGYSELYFRSVFRRVPQSQWKDYGQQNFYGGTLGGTITKVDVSAPEKTEEPFTLSYDYTLRDFSGGVQHRFAVPLSIVSIPDIKADDLKRMTPLWLGSVGEAMYESRIELPKGWTAAQPMPLDLNESFAEFHGRTEVDGNVLVTKRRLLLKVDAITPDQLKSYKEFRKAISDNHALYISLRLPADVPATGPVSTPAQEVARALELAIHSVIQLPGSSNPEALQSEQDAWKSMRAKDYAPAITALSRAASLDPTFSRAWIALGVTYYGKGEPKPYLNAFQKAVEADPKQVVPYKILAFMYLGIGRRDDATATWKKLQSVSPDDPDLKANFSASH